MIYESDKTKTKKMTKRLMELNPEMAKTVRDCLIRTNLLYNLADMLESLLVDTCDRHKQIGFELRMDVKRNYNAVIHHCRLIRMDVRKTSQETQEWLGIDSDMLLAMVLLLVDRCGEDDMMMWKIFNYIKAIPSKRMIKLDDIDEAFEHIFTPYEEKETDNHSSPSE